MQELFRTLTALGVTSQVFPARVESLLTPLGLTYSQFAMLIHLSEMERGQSISELAGSFQIQQPGVSKMVVKLETNRWVTATPDPLDVRKKLVSITSAGRKTITEAQSLLSGEVLGWFDGWSKKEQAQFAELLERMNEMLQK